MCIDAYRIRTEFYSSMRIYRVECDSQQTYAAKLAVKKLVCKKMAYSQRSSSRGHDVRMDVINKCAIVSNVFVYMFAGGQ